MARVSLVDISNATGYSTATVSNALNHKRNVGEETAATIRRVARELGYQRRAEMERIHFVLVHRADFDIDESTHHPFVIEGVEGAARKNGLKTTFTHLHLDDPDWKTVAASLCADTSGGVVLLGTEMDEECLGPFRDAASPVVLIDCWSNQTDFDAVSIANEGATHRAITYLVERGHRSIGYIASRYRIQNFREREHGLRLALQDAGLDYQSYVRVEVGATIDGAYDDMRAWLATSPKLPTAFFADNDVIAVSALRALEETGHRVPSDVSLIGFDDVSLAAASNPPLTTVHVPRTHMGAQAVRILLARAADDSRDGMTMPPMRCQLSARLVERASVTNI